jgi:hypothetical protein
MSIVVSMRLKSTSVAILAAVAWNQIKCVIAGIVSLTEDLERDKGGLKPRLAFLERGC